MTADTLNNHLKSGGRVVVSTMTRATVYDSRHAGFFSAGAKTGNLYVQSGRGKTCLSTAGGEILLVGIRMAP